MVALADRQNSLRAVDEMTINNWETNRTDSVIRFVPRIIQFLGYTPYTIGEALPERLRAQRRVMGLSYKRLARLLGVDESSLRSWESGSKNPSIKCSQILEAFLTD